MLEMDAVVVQLQTEGHGNWSEVTPNTCWFLFFQETMYYSKIKRLTNRKLSFWSTSCTFLPQCVKKLRPLPLQAVVEVCLF